MAYDPGFPNADKDAHLVENKARIKPDYSILSTDAFPVPAADSEGRILEFTDTGHRFRWTGVVWVQSHITGKALVSDKPDYSQLSSVTKPTLTAGDSGVTLEYTDNGDRFRWTGSLWTQTHEAGNEIATDFYFEVGAGRVTAHAPVNKFGNNENVGTSHETIWDQGGKLTYSTIADISGVSSSSASDTTITINVNGLDTNWNEVDVAVTLNGQNEVTMGTALIRVHRIWVTSSAVIGDPVGDIYVYVGGSALTGGVPSTASNIRGKITQGKNRTLMAVYSIPAAKTGYIAYGKTSAASGKDVHLEFIARIFGGVFQVSHVVDMNAANYDYFFKLPQAMPAKTDLEVHALCDAGTVSVSAAFDIILVDT